MTTYREGQEVEVSEPRGDYRDLWWRKAKIIKLAGAADLPDCGGLNHYAVQFPSGATGIFDEQHIREIKTITDYHEGQQVEVAVAIDGSLNAPMSSRKWRKAMVLHAPGLLHQVRFTDGKRGVFNEEHIRLSKEQVANRSTK